MHIVFDLQTATSSAQRTDGPRGVASGLRLAMALVRSAPMNGHRVSVVLPAGEMDGVIHIRRRLADALSDDRVAFHVWHPVAGATSWHRQANAVLYHQLMGRLNADTLVIDDPFGRSGHPLAGASDWLPSACTGILLVESDMKPSDLSKGAAAWSQALEGHRVAMCTLRNQHAKGASAMPESVIPLPFPQDDDIDSASRVARALGEVLERLRPEVPAAAAANPDAPCPKPRLAYVSPLPPARTGIADYSADLIGALATHYDIDVVTDQTDVAVDELPPGVRLRTVAWFAGRGDSFDRVLYHFGNSPFHHHMLALCKRYPGTVVLHDFYFGDLLFYLGSRAGDQGAGWLQTYYRAHGYRALREALQGDQQRELLARYPVNFEFLQHSRGVIVHSRRSCELAAQWLPAELAGRFRHVPLLRVPARTDDRQALRSEARRMLDMRSERFLVCCFGMVGQAKANLEILEAWLRADEIVGGNTELVFVGANEESAYGQKLLSAIAGAGDAKNRVRITGWIDGDGYRRYLDAADAAVQLRTIDRGETSAAVLDCMNHGLATIVNAKGSMSELPAEAVCMIPAECRTQDVTDALVRLHRDPVARTALATIAADLLHQHHAPSACAQAYHDVLEKDFYRHDAGFWESAVPVLAKLPGTASQSREVIAALSNATAATLPSPRSGKQLLVDVSAICNNDLRTGIQRVVRALLVELIESPPPGYRIEPVYLCDRIGAWHMRYARRYTQGLLGIPPQQNALEDEIVEAQAGDRFLGLDFSSGYIVEAARLRLFDALRCNGVAMDFVVYDLLPVLRPEVFPREASVTHEPWLRTILELSDSVACISQAVASELQEWAARHAPDTQARIAAFHLGADMAASAPTRGLPDDAAQILAALRQRPTFLAVGTVEPRKGIAQALAAFELLWAQGTDANLVLVGKPGWQVDTLVAALKEHPERGRRLFWLAGISDEFLEAVYSHATCLLAVSEAEGFGLPLIEAAQKGLPILARDIPVFREVAGEHAFFFSGFQPADLADSVRAWLDLHATDRHPSSEKMPWLTWRQSAAQLKKALRIS